jgi:predicted esterase
MRTLLSLATAFILLSLVAHAAPQEPDNSAEFRRHFDAGIAALTDGRHDEGIAAFTKCLELDPENGTCAYNIACGYSLKKEIEPAFEWLGKATDWWFGSSAQTIELAETKDPDLANLRTDARFAPLIARMKEQFAAREKAAEAEWKAPIVIVPKALEGEETVGALVVLHDLGSSKKAISESYWKGIAEELGLALVIPSGKHFAGRKAEDGMAWFHDFDAFRVRYWIAEDSLAPAFDALKKIKKVDPARTYIAGVGQGAIIAFNAAMRAPKVYAGVLAVDGPVLPDLVKDHAANAATSGLKAHVLVSRAGMFGIPATQFSAFVGQMRSQLLATKVGGEVVEYTAKAEEPEQLRTLVLGALKGLAASRVAVEPATGK